MESSTILYQVGKFCLICSGINLIVIPSNFYGHVKKMVRDHPFPDWNKEPVVDCIFGIVIRSIFIPWFSATYAGYKWCFYPGPIGTWRIILALLNYAYTRDKSYVDAVFQPTLWLWKHPSQLYRENLYRYIVYPFGSCSWVPLFLLRKK